MMGFNKNLCHDSSSKDFVAILHHHVDELAVGQINSAMKGPYTLVKLVWMWL